LRAQVIRGSAKGTTWALFKMLRENIPRPSAMTPSGRRGCAAIVAGSRWQGKYPARQSDAPGSAKMYWLESSRIFDEPIPCPGLRAGHLEDAGNTSRDFRRSNTHRRNGSLDPARNARRPNDVRAHRCHEDIEPERQTNVLPNPQG